MYDACLVQALGKDHLNHLRHSFQAPHDGEEDILYAAILQTGEDGRPANRLEPNIRSGLIYLKLSACKIQANGAGT